MKLLPTDGFGFETDQFGSTKTDQFGFKTDKNGYKMDKNPHISVPYPHIFAGPHKSVQNPHKSVSTSYPHKSVDTYLYFIEGHISIMALLSYKCFQVLLECQALKLKNGKFIQSKMVKIKEYLWKFNF
jgi:hypothetical protein